MKRKVMAIASAALFVLMVGVVAHSQAKPANVAGAWTISQMGRNGVQMQTLTLTVDGTKLTGTIVRVAGAGGPGGGGAGGGQGGGGGAAPAPTDVTGTITGNTIDFTFTRAGRGGAPGMPLEYKGTVTGDSMKGTVSMGGMDVDWTADRAK